MALIVPRFGILVTRDPNQLLDPKNQTRLPRVVGCNLVHLAFKEFIKWYGTAVFDSFNCPSGVSLLLFSQLWIYYYMDVCTIQTSGIHTDLRNTYGHDWPSNKKITKKPKYSSNKEGFMDKVIVGSKQELLYIPGNSTITVPGAVRRSLHAATCLVEQAAHSILPCGIIVNRCLAHPKVKSVPVILVNRNSENILIRQSLLVTDLVEVKCHSWEYDRSLDRYGDEVRITFQPHTSTDTDASLQEMNVQMEDVWSWRAWEDL